MGVVRELITKWSFLADTSSLVAAEKLFESLLQQSKKLGNQLGSLKIEFKVSDQGLEKLFNPAMESLHALEKKISDFKPDTGFSPDNLSEFAEKSEKIFAQMISQSNNIKNTLGNLAIRVAPEKGLDGYFDHAIKDLSTLENRLDSFLKKSSSDQNKSGHESKKPDTTDFTLRLPSAKKLKTFEQQFEKVVPVIAKGEKELQKFLVTLNKTTNKSSELSFLKKDFLEVIRTISGADKDLNRSLKESDKALTTLGKNKGLTQLSKNLKASSRESESLISRLQRGMGSMENMVAIGVAGTTAGMLALTKGIGDTGFQTDKDSKRLGISSDNLQALQYSASLVNTEKNRLMDALKDFSERTQDANLLGGGEAVEAFTVMGMSIKDTNGKLKSNTRLLEESADWFAKNTDERKKILVADMLFADAGYDLIPMLNQGSEALKTQRAEAEKLGLILNQKTIDASLKFQKAMKRGENFVKGLGMELGSTLLPALSSTIDKWEKYGEQNREVMSDGMETWLQTGISLMDTLSNAMQFVINATFKFTQAMGGTQGAVSVLTTGIGVLVGIITIMNAQVLLIPALIAAGAALIAVMIQDIMTWANGGESMFGDLLESIKDFFSIFKGTPVEAALNKWMELFNLIFTEVVPDTLGKFSEYMDPVKDAISDTWELLQSLLDGFAENRVIQWVFSNLENAADSGIEKIRKMQAGSDETGAITGTNDQAFSMAEIPPMEFDRLMNGQLSFSPSSHPQQNVTKNTPVNISINPTRTYEIPADKSPREFAKEQTNYETAEWERLLANGIARDLPDMIER